jgi:hypothetical protein
MLRSEPTEVLTAQLRSRQAALSTLNDAVVLLSRRSPIDSLEVACP